MPVVMVGLCFPLANLIWANRTRIEKICIICHFFFWKAKLVRAGKWRYHNVVKWYLLKMDSMKWEEKMTNKIFSQIFLIDFLGHFSNRLRNISTLSEHIFNNITLLHLHIKPTISLLYTMKESLVWSFQNTPIIYYSYHSVINADHSKLRDFQ